jgi:hemerythrin-like domain-containing protein
VVHERPIAEERERDPGALPFAHSSPTTSIMSHSKPDAGRCGCACGRAHPVDVLSQEHQTILSVLGAMDAELRQLHGGAAIRAPFWLSVFDFVEHYADQCHHGKEEQLLFAELERCGLPAQHGPTACMRAEHEQGRQRRKQMEQALQAGDGKALASAAGGYVTLMREHIDKEDRVLFPMAKSMLDHAAVARLRAGFERVEHVDMGEGAHCRYEELARSLTADRSLAS